MHTIVDTLIGKARGMAAQEYLGIEITAGSLRVALVTAGPKKKEVSAVLSRSIAGMSDADIAKALAELIKPFAHRARRIVLAVPSSSVIIKNIEVPSVDQREIRDIVNLQAGRHTPHSREEVIIDYISIGTFKQSYTKVLLLIVSSGVVKKQFAITEKAAVAVQKASLAQETIAAQARQLVGVDSQAAAAAIVNIDETMSDFLVVLKNRLVFMRSFALGWSQFNSDKDKAYLKFADEVHKSLEAYQAENAADMPASLVLTGALAEHEKLEGMTNEAVHIPVRSVNYAGFLVASPQAAAALAQPAPISFLNVLASLFGFTESKVNLIPEEVRLKRALTQRSKDLVITGVLFLICLCLVFTIMVSTIYFKTAYLKKVSQRYLSLEQDTRELEAALGKNAQVRSYLQSRGDSIRVLSALHQLAPLSVELTDIRFDREARFTIRGTAESMATVFSFADALEKSRYFKDVKTKNTAKRQDGKKDVTDFEINLAVVRGAP